jgi:hypothetical protein
MAAPVGGAPEGEHLARAKDKAIHRVHREAEVRDLPLLQGEVSCPKATTERRGMSSDHDWQRVRPSGARERRSPGAVAELPGCAELRHTGSEQERVAGGHPRSSPWRWPRCCQGSSIGRSSSWFRAHAERSSGAARSGRQPLGFPYRRDSPVCPAATFARLAPAVKDRMDLLVAARCGVLQSLQDAVTAGALPSHSTAQLEQVLGRRPGPWFPGRTYPDRSTYNGSR